MKKVVLNKTYFFLCGVDSIKLMIECDFMCSMIGYLFMNLIIVEKILAFLGAVFFC